jgi:hypothetical protein
MKCTFALCARVQDDWVLDGGACSAGLELSGDARGAHVSATASDTGDLSHFYTFATKTWGGGRHAWRTTIDSEGWVFIGVAQRKLLLTAPVGNRSFGDDSAWGISSRTQVCPSVRLSVGLSALNSTPARSIYLYPFIDFLL